MGGHGREGLCADQLPTLIKHLLACEDKVRKGRRRMRNRRGGGQGAEEEEDKEWTRRSGMDEEKKRRRVEGEEGEEHKGKGRGE